MSELNNYKYFYFSFFIIIFTNILYNNFEIINSGNDRLFKTILNLHIYFSLYFLLIKIHFKNIIYQNNYRMFLFLLIFSIAQILRPPALNYDLFIQNYWQSKIGGLNYDVVFLIPFFYFWAFYKDSIYWFEKISLFSIKIGILILILNFFLDIKINFYYFFLPIFYLLAGFKYSKLQRKFWILLGFVLGNYIFIIEVYRSGYIRSFLVLIILLVLNFKLKKLNLLIVTLCFFVPLFTVSYTFFFDQSIFSLIYNFFDLSENINTVDTRSFIYKEIIDHLKNANNIWIGEGGFANYYSDYFNNWDLLGKTKGDFFIRSSFEVGVLGLLMKGGIIYLILFLLVVYNCVFFTIKNTSNKYIFNLSLVLTVYVMYMAVENTIRFDILNISFWIIISIVSSINLNRLTENQIKDVFKVL